MIENVKNVLGRRFGPLPVLAWIGIGIVALLLYRRFKGQQGTSPVGELQAAPDFHDPLILEPGERVYDPNSGQLVGGDGGGGGGNGGGGGGSGGGGNGEPPPSGGDGGPTFKGQGVSEMYLPPGVRKKIGDRLRHQVLKGMKRKGGVKKKVRPHTGKHRPKHPEHTKKSHTPRAAAHVKHNRRSKPAAKRPNRHPARQRMQVFSRGKAGRGRTSMPPSAALRQRPHPARHMDHTQQKAVKHGGHNPPPPQPPPQSRKAAAHKRRRRHR